MMIVPAEAKGLFAEPNVIDPGPKWHRLLPLLGFQIF
jgi:hypothetical protein